VLVDAGEALGLFDEVHPLVGELGGKLFDASEALPKLLLDFSSTGVARRSSVGGLEELVAFDGLRRCGRDGSGKLLLFEKFASKVACPSFETGHLFLQTASRVFPEPALLGKFAFSLDDFGDSGVEFGGATSDGSTFATGEIGGGGTFIAKLSPGFLEFTAAEFDLGIEPQSGLIKLLPIGGEPLLFAFQMSSFLGKFALALLEPGAFSGPVAMKALFEATPQGQGASAGEEDLLPIFFSILAEPTQSRGFLGDGGLVFGFLLA
jgi:hypothetical protein